jgi:hypothetical protein
VAAISLSKLTKVYATGVKALDALDEIEQEIHLNPQHGMQWCR